jgi:Galactose mutarotase-like
MLCSFIFKDQFIEITTAVPAADDLYGLGEVSLPTGLRLPRDGSVITLWARDLPSALPYVNLYGSHPFYMQVSKGAPQGTESAIKIHILPVEKTSACPHQ